MNNDKKIRAGHRFAAFEQSVAFALWFHSSISTSYLALCCFLHPPLADVFVYQDPMLLTEH